LPNHAIKTGIDMFLAENACASLHQKIEVPSHFMCPLSRRIMKESVLCSDRITYEKNEIERWLVISDKCPNSDRMMPNRTVTTNNKLKSEMIMFDWQEFVRKTYEAPVPQVKENYPKDLHICVTTPDDQTMHLEVRSKDQVIDVKEELYKRGEAPPKLQRLMYDYIELGNDRTLADCGIQNNSKLHMVFRRFSFLDR